MGIESLRIPNRTPQEIETIINDKIPVKYFSPPINIDLIVEKEFSFDLHPLEGIRKFNYPTDAFYSHRIKTIFYDPSVSEVRQRFSIAHELGHHILHEYILEQI